MMDEISRITKFLLRDVRGKKQLMIGAAGLMIALSLFLFNFFILVNQLEPKFFYFYASAKLFFFDGLDVYGANFIPQIQAFADQMNLGLILRETSFSLPAFALYIFYPFTLIGNFNFAQALWITFNQILIIVIFILLLRLLDWKMGPSMFWIQAAIAILFFSNWFNVLDQNISLVQSGFFITSIYFYNKEKSILSGIFLGLCLINPFYFLAPVIIFILILIKKHETSALFWIFITVTFLILSSLIFNPNWIIPYLKSLIANPSIFPFKSSSENLAEMLNLANNNFLKVVPWFALVWMGVEWLRTPCYQYLQQFWMISLAVILGQFITVQPNPVNSVLLFSVYIFILFLWIDRTEKIGNILIYLLGITLSLGVLVIKYIISKSLFPLEYFQIINIAISVFLLVNLYWIRGWAMSHYSLDNFVNR